LKIPFVVKLCSDKAAFEVKIQRKISFNMTDLERLLRSLKENEIIVNTPHILIFRSKGAEVTLSRNGRMLIKKVRNEKEAAAVAREVLRVASKALL
jgi:ArsR family metal-binding transcriptional regulator